MKRIIHISLVILSFAGITTLISAAAIKANNDATTKAYIEIHRHNNNGFIDKNEMLTNLGLNDTLITLNKKKNIYTESIEDSIMNNPFVKKTDVYFSIDGGLIINISEREPVLRIFTDKESFYIDKEGDIFPTSSSYSPMVMVANGYLGTWSETIGTNIYDTIYNNSKIRNLFTLNTLINKYPLLSSQINQLYINSKNEYDIVPELGNHIVQMGRFEDIETKLCNLNAYYQKILKTDSWDSYKTINLTYKNQIVCTKK